MKVSFFSRIPALLCAASIAGLAIPAHAVVITVRAPSTVSAIHTAIPNVKNDDIDGLGSYFFSATFVYGGSNYVVFGPGALNQNDTRSYMFGRNNAGGSTLRGINYGFDATQPTSDAFTIDTAGQVVTLVMEFQYLTATTGNINFWAISTKDGGVTTQGSLDFDSPLTTTTFTADQLTETNVWLRTQGSNTATSAFSNVSAYWAETTADRAAAALQAGLIPEPATALLGGIGLLTLLRRRR